MEINNLSPEFFKFIIDNQNEDVNKLALRLSKREFKFNLIDALQQIECRIKFKHKLSDFFNFPLVIVPDKLIAEQSTHQAVAKFHSFLLKNHHLVADLTGGLGIDSFALASTNRKVEICEFDPDRYDTLLYNSNIMGVKNIKVINDDCINFIKNTDNYYDLLFIDPARRDTNMKKVFSFYDCKPDIKKNWEILKSKSKKIVVKCSPMLDISKVIKELDDISEIYAVSLNGELKELLIIADTADLSKNTNSIKLHATIIDNNGEVISRITIEERDKTENYDYYYEKGELTDKFLYQPDVALMKISPWPQLAFIYPDLKKLDISTHLFISDSYYSDFPGRKLKILKILKNDDLLKLKGMKLNVVSKNFVMSSERIRKKYKIKEGTKDYLYATKIKGKLIFMLASLVDE